MRKMSGYNNLFKCMAMGMIILMGFSGSSNMLFVSAQSIPQDPTIFYDIDSRFILWDTNEKMIDAKFNITIIYFNVSNNHSSNYDIIVDGISKKGNFTFSHTEFYNITTKQSINIKIVVDEKIILDAYSISLTSGVSESRINQAKEPFTLNLSPFEWSKMEWNIFYAIVLCSMFSLLISYRIVKRYKQTKGFVEVK